MKSFLTAFAFIVTALSAVSAPRPPISNLSGLNDVGITTPTDGQALTLAGGVWINSNTLSDIIVVTAIDGDTAANFTTHILSSKGSDLLDWSDSKLKPLVPLYDSSNLPTIDVGGRKLYKTDGITSIFDWSGSAPKFPTLTNLSATAFLQTDASGNISVVSVPNAGIIPATTNLLIGDGAGNSLNANVDGLNIVSDSLTLGINGNFRTSIFAGNSDALAGHTSASAAFVANAINSVTLEALGPFFVTSGIFSAGDARLMSDTNLDVSVGIGSFFKFSNDVGSTERLRIGNGLMVGTTIDPGAGVVNVNTGFRIGNAAPYNHVAVSTDGATYKDGSVPGKASVTSTVDQTATTETAHVVYTVPANSAAVGTVYRIHASGNVDNGTTGITFTPRIRWGGTGGIQLLATPTFTASTTANTNRAWELTAYITVRVISAVGSATADIKYVERSTSTTGVETSHTDNSGTSAVAIDTTANKDLDLTWSLSATTGTPHIRTINGTIEVVKP